MALLFPSRAFLYLARLYLHVYNSSMKKLLTLILTLILLLAQLQVYALTVDVDGVSTRVPNRNIPANEYGDRTAICDKQYGYFMDGRGQVPEYARIAPPHEENIPVPRATKTVVPYARYYEINKQGYRPMGYQAPLVPNYNYFYSNRRAKPYTKADYVNVWCEGIADPAKGICTTKDKVYYYYDVYHWSTAIAATQFRDLKRLGDGKARAYVFWANDLGLYAEQMHAAKEWAELFDMEIHFVTIDAYIPLDFLL